MGAFFIAQFCKNVTVSCNTVLGTNGSRVMSVEKSTEDITIVGVFREAPVRFVAALMNEDLIEIAELCGNEDDAYIESLRMALRTPDEKAIIHATPVKDSATLDEALASAADMAQLDIATPDFDLALLASVEKPYFLAGFGPESIGDVLAQTGAGYVDAGTLANADSTRAFVQAVRAWDEANPRLSFLESLHPEYHEDEDANAVNPELN
jgi:phosphoribosylanthranilate isomerase